MFFKRTAETKKMNDSFFWLSTYVDKYLFFPRDGVCLNHCLCLLRESPLELLLSVVLLTKLDLAEAVVAVYKGRGVTRNNGTIVCLSRNLFISVVHKLLLISNDKLLNYNRLHQRPLDTLAMRKGLAQGFEDHSLEGILSFKLQTFLSFKSVL